MKVTYGAIVQRASGKFGGTVHSNWKGVDVVRRFAKPSNPNTTDQQFVRDAFRYLTASFLLQTANLRASWDSYVTGKALINRNAWLGKNVAPLFGQNDLTAIVATPGDSSTLPPVSMVITPGSEQLSVAVTTPPVPTGWTIASVAAAACVNWDPSAGTPPTPAELQWFEATDASAPYAPVITGLTAAVEYVVAAFIVWTAPDATTRYSASVTGTGTPTA